MTPDEIERHENHLSEFSHSGGSLRTDAPTATVNNPAWFIDGDLTFERQQFYARVRVTMRHWGRCRTLSIILNSSFALLQ
ncbi:MULTISPECIES: hypothetical protein [unclassified Cryobacterium]|uniref:hypothetical protein n=1 Tax=unclassified Cryobacterium TaxID=2649013 RepID=UPI002AB3863B|nr:MULTISPECIES: hypothetical protein [unclassified Cryobacterium]MDY7544457.1 hypothetical protein [Cryobacterium sp. 5B3]MEB0000299.1 hypothetical protein [Cryobacterium sp. RTS3]MEB0267379.1 hypothetical protein [Cryobacterium sp. 10I5]MEB0276313.1 hypothetical protein [Cryobacterium sp. 5B3]